MRNIAPEQPLSTDLDALAEPASAPDKVAEAAAALEDQVETLTDDRLEERFAWIVVSMILFDAALFHDAESWSGPLVIGILELVLLVVLARKYQIQEVSQILAKFLDRAADYTNKPKA